MSKPAGERYTVAVDFDGVLHRYTTPWLGPEIIPDPPITGAIAWLNEIVKDFEVVIFTTRGKTLDGRCAVRAWLGANGFKGDAQITWEKPPALIYIDDRAWRFEGIFPTTQEIHRARPWKEAIP